MSGGALRIERLRKRYGSLEALRIPELQVHEGELMAILGPSGSGKSTLLRTIAGFVHPDEGQIWLFGEEITWRPPSQRRMGVVFQQYSLFPHWSAEGNVRFALELRGLSRLEQARELNALFDLIGLQEARSRFPHQLSGGEQQRVALARALAVAPRVLLLDEPLSALDAVVRLQLREEIRRIQRATGVTTLFVTHDQHEALSLADRVAVMRAGRLEQLGTPQEIYHRPINPFVASFVGASASLRGEVVDPEEGWVLLGGARFLLQSARGWRGRSEVVAYVRPEFIRLDPSGPLQGVVFERIFLGGRERLKVRLASGEHVEVELESSPVGIGDRVGLSFKNEPVLFGSA